MPPGEKGPHRKPGEELGQICQDFEEGGGILGRDIPQINFDQGGLEKNGLAIESCETISYVRCAAEQVIQAMPGYPRWKRRNHFA